MKYLNSISNVSLGLAFVLILATAVFFRFLWLETVPGLNGDEAWLGWKAYGAAHGGSLDWKTNSGNFTNPFFLLPLVWVHHVFEPSAWVIRSVSAVSGVLALAVNFFFCRWILDNKAASVSTLLLAVSPMAIGYSRFGWEPSQIPLFSIVILYGSLALCDSRRYFLRWGIFSGLGLFFGFLVHPTMAFLALFPMIAVLSRWIRPEESFMRVGGLVLSGGLSAFFLGLVMYSQAPAWVRPEISSRFVEWAWVGDLPRFFVAWLRNLNGINFWEHLVGSWPGASEILKPGQSWPVFVWDVVYGVVILSAIIFIGIFSFQFMRNGERASVCDSRIGLVLVVAWFCGTILFGVMNGSQKVAVWFDRYGLWALVPGCLIVALGYAVGARLFPKVAWLLTGCVLLISSSSLILFWDGYFRSFSSTAGNSPWIGTRVGKEQIPSQAVGLLGEYSAAEEYTKSSARPVLISSDWFAYWPTIYYSLRVDSLKNWKGVYAGAEASEQLRGRNSFQERFANRDVTIVEFDGSPNWEEWRNVFPERRFFEQSVVIDDLAGRPNLRIDFPVAQ